MWRITTLVILLYTVLFFGIYHTWKKREQEVYLRHTSVLETTYKTTIHLYKTYAETLYDEVLNKREVLELVAEAYKASPERQAILRGRLYRLLYPTYTHLAENNIRQLHFHFPDNRSFLRFHRLEKYGDSLTDIRESVRLVNTLHKSIFGFENGKIFCGFRYVFPLQYKGNHVGSVETSVSFKAIQKAMTDAAPMYKYLFIQKQDVVMAKAFPDEREFYTPVSVYPGYVVEDLRILGFDIENPIFPLARRLNPILAKNKGIQNNIADEKRFSIFIGDQNKNYIVAGLPLHNVKGEQVAYILSYEENYEIVTLWNTFRAIVFGLTVLVFALGFFVWQRQQAVEQLKRNEARLSAIARYMGDALYVNNAKGEITFINSAMEKQLGYSPGELLGKDAHELFHRHKKNGVIDTYGECRLLNENMAGRTFSDDKDYFLHKDGSIIPVEVKGTPLQSKGGKRGSVVIFRDITDRLQAEDDRIKVTKLEAIGVLAGGISHDFNNLLTAIMGNIELAKMLTIDNSDVNELLGEAKSASQRATILANQLRTFSKGGSPVTSAIDLAIFLPDIVSFILSGRPIHSEFLFDNDLWTVQIDPGQIRQVIANVLMNAVESMGEKGTITISCYNHRPGSQTPSQSQKRYVCMEVQDTGTGIPEEHIDKIFDPYFSTKAKGSTKGSGLGLSIVHSIIKQHGGYIEVKSSAEKGTCFSIYLPAVTKSGSDIVIKENEEKPKMGSGKILIMDDEIALLNMVSIMLNRLGYKTEQAKNGEQAIKRYSQALDAGNPFDAVILDLTIKNGMGGEKTIAELQVIDPEVVAIVSSGYADSPVMSDCQQYGFKDSVPKPFDVKTLSMSLHKVLAQEKTVTPRAG